MVVLYGYLYLKCVSNGTVLVFNRAFICEIHFGLQQRRNSNISILSYRDLFTENVLFWILLLENNKNKYKREKDRKSQGDLSTRARKGLYALVSINMPISKRKHECSHVQWVTTDQYAFLEQNSWERQIYVHWSLLSERVNRSKAYCKSLNC